MDHYEKLKEEIIKKASHTLDLENVKDYYRSIINSKRKLTKAKTLNDIFCLLEKRDALDSNNIFTLKYLGSLLKNTDIKNLIHGYEKLYTEQETCVCGENRIFSLPILNPNAENTERNECNDELQSAVHTIALNIGKNWRVLASELCVQECYVDEVREKYPGDYQRQALKILEIWIKYNGEAATLETLKEKLESRLCKKKGVGLHMLKPPITVE